jgi:hypothetical protein
MNSDLNKLTKIELLNIIQKMKKDDLINIIQNKIGGGNSNIIKETNNAIRRSIKVNKNKLRNINIESNNSNTMGDDILYNKMYYKVN